MYPIIFDPAATYTVAQFEPLITTAVQTLVAQGNVRIDDRLHNSLLVEEPGPEYKAPLLRVDYNQAHDITLIVQRDSETGNTIEVRFDRNGILQRRQENLQQERQFHIKEWINKKTVRHLVHDCYQPFRNPLGDVYIGRRRINYPSGKPHFEMNYNVRGKLDGPYKKWNGKILSEELMFFNGKRYGTCWFHYTDTAEPQVFMETRYEAGKKHGLEIVYNRDGTIREVNHYMNGRLSAPAAPIAPSD